MVSQSRQEGDDSKHTPEKFGMPHWLSLIDPEMDDEEALNFIELPQETIYLIDKVVRQKARAGPIGIDNSEFINIEIEEEFKEKNTHIQKLVDGYKTKETQHHSDDDTLEDEDGNKENQHNQRLLDRLSTAAARIPSTTALGTLQGGNNVSHISAAGASIMQRSTIGDRSSNAVTHEEWMRRKEHQTKLKEQLVREAKKDILEQIRHHQAEEKQRREEKHHLMMQWEERKRSEDEHKKILGYKKQEEDYLNKQVKKE